MPTSPTIAHTRPELNITDVLSSIPIREPISSLSLRSLKSRPDSDPDDFRPILLLELLNRFSVPSARHHSILLPFIIDFLDLSVGKRM